jgi:hypothetical protein
MGSQFPSGSELEAKAAQIQAEARRNAPKPPVAEIEKSLADADDLLRRIEENNALLAKLRAQRAMEEPTS